MKRSLLPLASLPLALAFAATSACVGGADSGTDYDWSPPSAAATAAPGSVAERLERAERQVDVGAGAEASAHLAALRADPAATPEQRDQAAFALARALEAQGDTAGAVKTLEELLASRGNERSWPLGHATEGALRRLLTGSDKSPRGAPARSEDQPVAPFARALTKYFVEENGGIHVTLFGFGGSSGVSDKLGTFNVARAIRDERERTCPLCDVNLSIWTSSSRTDDWLGIIRAGADRRRGLAVYYFSLGDKRIPAHFDPELPLPAAEIEARLTRGEGVLAAKERPGAPPAILVAAPRSAELPDVEEALSKLDALPLEPVAVPLSDRLRPQEIDDVVKNSRKDQRACYSALLERSPSAEGTIKLKLSVAAEGNVSEVTSDPSAGVRDPEFVACMEGVAKKLAFPATGSRGTIVVPVRVASR